MGSAFHQLCQRHSGTLTPTAPTAIKLWDTFTLFYPISTAYYIRERGEYRKISADSESTDAKNTN